MDYSQLSDQEINAMVGKIVSTDGLSIIASDGNAVIHEYADCGEFKGICLGWKVFDPCNNWSDGGPIIVSNQISLMYEEAIGKWCAGKPYWVDGCEWQLDIDVMEANPLRSAMIFFLIMQDANHV
ncbi:phage protein NinX family protein [Enterobacter cloacae]|uniref:phage protein NinX family protein n=1 Tax=Enterobacter cloacae TaxID=550 RepID=UPI002FD77399